MKDEKNNSTRNKQEKNHASYITEIYQRKFSCFYLLGVQNSHYVPDFALPVLNVFHFHEVKRGSNQHSSWIKHLYKVSTCGLIHKDIQLTFSTWDISTSSIWVLLLKLTPLTMKNDRHFWLYRLLWGWKSEYTPFKKFFTHFENNYNINKQ